VLAVFYEDDYCEWHDGEPQAEIVPEEVFLEKMSLDLIEIDGDGGFNFWFSDDDGLLDGHSLILEGNITKGFVGTIEMFG
jgi:hypothetical protein